MANTITNEELYQAGELKVRCLCGWDNDGKLIIVDRYATDAPPGPRGSNPASWHEVYLDWGGDPDDRVDECPNCGESLDVDHLTRREAS